MTDIPIPMPIMTPRLMLRPIQVSDAEAMLDYKRESWAEFQKWMTWVHPPSIEIRTVEDERKFCTHFIGRLERREAIPCLAFSRADGTLIGSGNLNHCKWDIPMFILGYAVRTGKTGQGYATETGTALARYAFEALGARKIATFYADGNIGSKRAIEKIGFEKEGVLRKQHLLADGALVDEHHYGMLDAGRLPEMDVKWGGRD